MTPKRLLAPLAAAALAAGALAALPAGADGPNLIANPGAEDGSEAPAEEGQVTPPRGWAQGSGLLTVGDYGTGGLPPATHAEEIGGGVRLFHGGPCPEAGPCSASAHQELDVSASAREIDAGSVRADVAAAIGGQGTEPDAGRIRVQFLGASSERLGELEIGPVTPADRGNETRLVQRSASRAVPAGTRRIRLALLGEGGEGERLDAYFDNVSLRLAGAAQPPANITPAPPREVDDGSGAGGGQTGDSGPAAISIGPSRLRMSRSGVVVLRTRCGRPARCTGRLALALGRRSCGSRRVSVAGNRVRRAPLRLRPACRRRVARSRGALPATISLRLSGGGIARAPATVRRG